eukprot:CAMPEP_0116850974 /NCGR_PEP_ID=MMETSP0418-20121206/16456_1 /TAXON_ID=1158023 /ORGANISM="Astrosyne radiata, Strain 13vi08-1A" /LENGTH=337 /DNA_ID=CAMNT_0004482927 /DNA_START=149 /DNA_END=1162 /DNA_ORIENTATION=+
MSRTYKAAVVKEAGAKFEIVEKEIPTGQVLIKVAACGICHSDKFAVHGWMPGITFPHIPGHEVIGTVAAVGDGVEWPPVGMPAGVGWHGGHCMFCGTCRRGNFKLCEKETVAGITADGGYQEYMLCHWTGVVELPEGIDPVAAAPLLCAGLTCFNGIRIQDNLHAGDLVAIQGIGGLGHLGIQFAAKMGYRVAAISSSDSKKELAMKLGAHYYINVSEKPASEQLQALGGASLIVATAPSSKSMEDLVNGLGPDGRLLLAGADAEKLAVSPLQLIPKRAHICGANSGIATDAADTVKFATLNGVESMNEVYSLDQVQEAYDHMLSGKPRFRVVLKMD